MPESVAALAPIGFAALSRQLRREAQGPSPLALEWAATIVLVGIASILHFTVHAIAVELTTTGVNWLAALRTVMLGGMLGNMILGAVVYWFVRIPHLWRRPIAGAIPIGRLTVQRRPRKGQSEGVAHEYSQHLAHREGFPVRAKVWILAGFILLLFGILVVQLVRLQILRHDEFVARAVSNRVRTIDIAPFARSDL